MISHASQRGLGLQPVSVQVMETLAGKDNPQSILAMVHQKTWRLAGLPPRNCQTAVAVVAPQDPGNLGAILRTLDAVGADILFLLDGGVDPYYPTSVRASMGTLFWKPIVQTGFDEFIKWARRGGYQLIGTSAHSSTDYRAVKPKLPWILTLGRAQKGLTSEQLADCDLVVSVPMHGRATSLNLAVAAGILLYQFAAHRTKHG